MKKIKCDACLKEYPKRQMTDFGNENPEINVCKWCMPRDCHYCSLEHAPGDIEKCRDNLFKILKNSIKGQDNIFKIISDHRSYFEKTLGKISKDWIADDEYGYGKLKQDPLDRYVKYKKSKIKK